MKPLFSLIPLLFGAAFAFSAEQPAAHTLSEFKLGPTISGPAVDLSNLNGKAVFIDCWGTHCPPCIALIPEVEKISQRYKDKLVVVGAESQNSPDELVNAMVKDKKMSYTVTHSVSSPVPFSGLPFGFVFDANGVLLFAGHPGDRACETAIHKAVQTVKGTAGSGGLDALKALQRK